MDTQETKKERLSPKTKRKLSYYTKRLFSLGGPAVYLLWVANIFETGIHEEGIKTLVVAIPVAVTAVLFNDYRKKALDKDNPDIKQKALATSLFSFVPWLLIGGTVTIIHIGLSNAYQHIMIISGMQIAAGMAKGFEQYYADVYIRREKTKL